MRYEAKHQVMKRLLNCTNNHNDSKSILIKALKYLVTKEAQVDDELILKYPIALTEKQRRQIKSECGRSIDLDVEAFSCITHRNITYQPGDFITTMNGYAYLHSVYQFKGRDSVIFFLVTYLQSNGLMPNTPYPIIDTVIKGPKIYIPYSLVKGRLHVVQLKGEKAVIVVHSAASVFSM